MCSVASRRNKHYFYAESPRLWCFPIITLKASMVNIDGHSISTVATRTSSCVMYVTVVGSTFVIYYIIFFGYVYWDDNIMDDAD